MRSTPRPGGTASGVTLGLSMSLGGLAAPLFGAYADATDLTAALTLLVAVPVIGTALTLTLPPVGEVHPRGTDRDHERR
jgi:MFS transporter, FSR family, fosmidomycin resistance protein